MDDRRQIHRRTPITLVFDNGSEIIARPLPWMQRNDLGQEIINQNTEAVNDAVRLMMDEESNLPQLELRLSNKLANPLQVLRVGYPDVESNFYSELSFTDITEALLALLEVNQLEHLKPLVDPNSLPPTESSGTSSSEAGTTEAGPKIESSPNSSSSDLVEAISSTSPTEK